jgi:pimeloyl-ACP methyl ester carboxylesterase
MIKVPLWNPGESSLLETAKGPIEYAVAGEGYPLLVIHGGPGGYDQALGLGDMFPPEGLKIICPSRPGYLRTPLSVGATIAEQADALVALLDGLGLDRFGVMGASAGGPPAYEMAIRYPQRVKALVAVDAVCRTYHLPQQAGAVEQKLFLSKPGEWLLNKMLDYFPKLVIANILKTEGYLNAAELQERLNQVVQDPQKLHYARVFFSSMSHYELRKAGVENDLMQLAAIDRLEVEKVQAPSLIIHGTADADVQFADADYAASTIPGAEHFWINRGTHLCFWLSDQAGEAQQRTIAFLKKHLL